MVDQQDDHVADTLAKTRRTQAQRRQQSEQGLLAAAAGVIGELGFNAATFDRISERAGYSRGLVTLRFGSKDGMVVAVIDFLGDRLEQIYAERLKNARTAKARLLGYVDTFMVQLRDDKQTIAYFVLLAGALANKLPQSRYFLEQHERVKLSLAGYIREGQADGTFAADIDPVAAATALGCFQLGLAMQYQLDPDFDMEDMRRFVIALAGA